MTTPPPSRYSWDDYLYPLDPDDPLNLRTLRNLLDITDRDDLHVAERMLTGGRADELAAHPELVPRTFDAEHWRAIHRHLFQDVYEWAGQWRTVDMGKGGTSFLDESLIGYMADWTLEQVRTADYFRQQPREQVVEGLAESMHALNLVHPFREGNGRTQRILMQHVAEQAGWLLVWDRHRNPFGTDEQSEAMAAAMEGDRQPLLELVDRALIPVIRGAASDDLDAPATSVQLVNRGPADGVNAAQIAQRSTSTRMSSPAGPPSSSTRVSDSDLGTTPGHRPSDLGRPDVGGTPRPGLHR